MPCSTAVWCVDTQNGKYTARDGRCYTGMWRKQLREGHGVELMPNGEKYDGMWSNNLKHGFGTVRYRNGKQRQGEWKRGERVRWTSAETRITRKSVAAATATPSGDQAPTVSTAVEAHKAPGGAGAGKGAGAGAPVQ